MGTGPSKRELQHFLKRFGLDKDSVSSPATTLSQSMIDIQRNAYNNSLTKRQTPQEYVDALLTPSYNQLALTKIEGPFDKLEWQNVGKTLYKLQKLGLTSIVISDNPHWKADKSTPNELSKRMLRETMALVEAIERSGGRARLIYGSALERWNNTIDVNLDFILSALNNNQIPVIVPILTEEDGLLKPISANSAVTALSQRLASQAVDPKLIPSKIVVINQEGGVPNHEIPGTTHSLVNVQEEFADIQSAFHKHVHWKENYPNTMADLSMIRDCLEHLPVTSSAIIAPTSSLPTALITNLVTDKPLYSSSLPISHHSRINQTKTTVLRHGIKINNHYDFKELDLKRLTGLLERSFQKKVNEEAFYERLKKVLAGAIVAGNYEGAVIMTREKAAGAATIGMGANYHAYLDKFAIAPSSQGIGLTDILWKKMCDQYPDLLWRSRHDNGVNKWYFERSSGNLRLKGTNWVLFWYGPKGYKNIEEYASIASSIPPSFY
ncbi:hypothetical protein BDF20DRAFT_253581 [Mycotypha africana]|uniref:uncharacterized protein n=1 Tax=Mycotypha africana TaxID=64632 RepID=UPI0023018806|nr:uncharacterized protein BDF20DRAFT_253581 [Mycotypha africana]KAI8987249.1 hypothetical protein BDF20DRAFT_253581 [Mycotypha africana]